MASLFDVTFLPLPEHPTAAQIFYQAFLTTSRNGIRSLDSMPKDVPLFVVGDSSKLLAQSYGFQKIFTSPDGTAQSLITSLKAACTPDQGPVLWARGDVAHVNFAQELPDFDVDERLTYHMVPLATLPDSLIHHLINDPPWGTLFLSQRWVTLFSALLRKAFLGKPPPMEYAFCISAAASEGLEAIFRHIHIAERPHLWSLIEKIHEAQRHPPA